MNITHLLFIAYLLNYNINVINSKIDLIKKAIVKPDYNFTQKLKLGRELSKLKKDNRFYLDTDITLLELMPYKYFSIKNLNERYGDFISNTIFLVNKNDNQVIAKIQEAQNYCSDLRIMYDSEIK